MEFYLHHLFLLKFSLLVEVNYSEKLTKKGVKKINRSTDEGIKVVV